jgi:hypothetical protein
LHGSRPRSSAPYGWDWLPGRFGRHVYILERMSRKLDLMWRTAASDRSDTAVPLGEASHSVHRAIIALSGPLETRHRNVGTRPPWLARTAGRSQACPGGRLAPDISPAFGQEYAERSKLSRASRCYESRMRQTTPVPPFAARSTHAQPRDCVGSPPPRSADPKWYNDSTKIGEFVAPDPDRSGPDRFQLTQAGSPPSRPGWLSCTPPSPPSDLRSVQGLADTDHHRPP